MIRFTTEGLNIHPGLLSSEQVNALFERAKPLLPTDENRPVLMTARSFGDLLVLIKNMSIFVGQITDRVAKLAQAVEAESTERPSSTVH